MNERVDMSDGKEATSHGEGEDDQIALSINFLEQNMWQSLCAKKDCITPA